MTDVLDELLDGVDLSSVETAQPVLRDGLYKLIVAEISVAPLKNRPDDGSQVVIKLTLDQSAKDTGGRDVNPGFPLYWRGTLFKHPSSDGDNKANEITKVNLARFQEALGLEKGPFMKAEYIGKPITAKAKITEYQGVSRNEVSQFVKTKSA